MRKFILIMAMIVSTTVIYSQTPKNDNNDLCNKVSEINRQKVILEIGTATWCYGCPYAMAGAEQLHEENPDEIVIIGYHHTDVLDFTQGLLRLSYYGINSLPTAIFDGTTKSMGGAIPSNYSVYAPIFEERINTPSNFTIGIEITPVDGDEYTVNATIGIVEGNSSENLAVLMVLTESGVVVSDKSTYNFVARAMYPNHNGTSVDFSTNIYQSVSQVVTIDDDWNYNNCEIVVFLQNMDTKEIHQGTSKMMSDINTGIQMPISTDEEIEIYPNPTDDFINIKANGDIQLITVYDESGQVLFSQPYCSGAICLSTSGFDPDLYIFRIVTSESAITKRVIVK